MTIGNNGFLDRLEALKGLHDLSEGATCKAPENWMSIWLSGDMKSGIIVTVRRAGDPPLVVRYLLDFRLGEEHLQGDWSDSRDPDTTQMLCLICVAVE